ncbi:MAG: hypothetical protein KGD59_11720 [Candidatus Heimdallarchaeota archaeon]|nr:hypothetical protein [Candidatus Heimdallarchaeota archaeon]MBY8995212.1 hypothetical protein [Candidatus Heimdallarchaeota archaeon]
MKKQFNKLKKNRNGIVGLIIVIVLILAIIGGVIAVFVTRGGPYTLIGETNYTYAPTTNLNLTLNIVNTAGSIEIEYDDTLTSLMEARLELWGRSEATIADAVNFTSSTAGGKVIISFDSGEVTWKWSDKDAFNQNLFVKINPDAIAEYSIITTAGSTDLDFDSLTESEIRMLDVTVTAGSITVDFGDNTFLNTSTVSLVSSAGSISVTSQDVKFVDDIAWTITTQAGSVDLIIDQVAIPADNYTATYDVSTGAGSVELLYTLDESNFGISITGQTSLGSITIPGGGNSYESSGYASESIKYIFNLETSAGSISAS